MDENDLKEHLSIDKPGHRKKLLIEITKLKQGETKKNERSPPNIEKSEESSIIPQKVTQNVNSDGESESEDEKQEVEESPNPIKLPSKFALKRVKKEHIERKEELGRGSYGVVYKCIFRKQE